MRSHKFELILRNVPDDLQSIGIAVAVGRVMGDAVRNTGIEVQVIGSDQVNVQEEPNLFARLGKEARS